ncbi:MAG: hypothetical protein OYG31_00955 [Candidatus Kaiserbacteria bacterium]|nr:hypothetical protein [Candidatus Kaiserbacteria bacterium]
MHLSVSFLQKNFLFFIPLLWFLLLPTVFGQTSVTQVSLQAYLLAGDTNIPLPSNNSTIHPGDRVLLVLNATPAPQQQIAPHLQCDLTSLDGTKRTIVDSARKFPQSRQVTMNIDARSGSGEVVCRVSVGSDASAGYVIGTPTHTFLVEAKPAVSITPYGRVKEGKQPARFLIEVVDIIKGISVDVGYACSRNGNRIIERSGQGAPTFTDTNRRRTIEVPVNESDGDGDIVCTIHESSAYRIVRGSATVAVDEDIPLVSLDTKDRVDQVNERDARIVFSVQLNKPAPRGGLTIDLSCRGSGFSGNLLDIPLGNRVVQSGRKLLAFPVNFSHVHVAHNRSSASITCSLKKSALYDVNSQKRSKRVQVQAKPLVSLTALPGVSSVYAGSEAVFKLSGAYLTSSLLVSLSCTHNKVPINIGSSTLLSKQQPARFVTIPTNQLEEGPITCSVSDNPEYNVENRKAEIRVLKASAIPVVSIDPDVSPVTMTFAGSKPSSGGSANIGFVVRAQSSGAAGADSVFVDLSCGLGTRGSAGESALRRRETISVPINDPRGHTVSISLTRLPFRGTFVYCRLEEYGEGNKGSLFQVGTSRSAEVAVNPLPAVSLQTNKTTALSVNDIVEVQLHSFYTEGLSGPVPISWNCSFPSDDVRVRRVAVKGQQEVGSYGGRAVVTNSPGLTVVGRFLVVGLGSSPGRGSVACSLEPQTDSDIVYLDDTFALAVTSPPALSIHAVVNGPVYTDGIARFSVRSNAASAADISARVSCRYGSGGAVRTSLANSGGFALIRSGLRSTDFTVDLRLGHRQQSQVVCSLQPGGDYAVIGRQASVTLTQPSDRPIISITPRDPVIGKENGRFQNAVFVINGTRIPAGGVTVGLKCQTQDLFVRDFQKTVDLSPGYSSVARVVSIQRLHVSPGYIACALRPSENRQYDIRGSLSEALVTVEYEEGICGPTGYSCESGKQYWVEGYYGPNTSALKCLGVGGGVDSAVCLDDIVPATPDPEQPGPQPPTDTCPLPSISFVTKTPAVRESEMNRTIRFGVRTDVSGLETRCIPTSISLYCKAVGSDVEIFPSGSRTAVPVRTQGSGEVAVAVEVVRGNVRDVVVECGIDGGPKQTFIVPGSSPQDPATDACVIPRLGSIVSGQSLCAGGWAMSGGVNVRIIGGDATYVWSCTDGSGNSQECKHGVREDVPVELRGYYKIVNHSGPGRVDVGPELVLQKNQSTQLFLRASTLDGSRFGFDIRDVKISCYYEKTESDQREFVFPVGPGGPAVFVTIPAGSSESAEVPTTIKGAEHLQGSDLTCRIELHGNSNNIYNPSGGDIVVAINGGKRGIGEFEQCWIVFYDKRGAGGIPDINPVISDEGDCYYYVQRCGGQSSSVPRDGIGITRTIDNCYTIDQVRKIGAYIKIGDQPLTCGCPGRGCQNYVPRKTDGSAQLFDPVSVNNLIRNYFSILHPDYQNSMGCTQFRSAYAKGSGDFDGKDGEIAYPFIPGSELYGFVSESPTDSGFRRHFSKPRTARAIFDRLRTNALRNPFMHGFVKDLEGFSVTSTGDDSCNFKKNGQTAAIGAVNRNPDTQAVFSCTNSIVGRQEGGYAFPAQIAYFTEHRGDTVGGTEDGEGYVLDDLVMAVSFVEKIREGSGSSGFSVDNLHIKCYDKEIGRSPELIFDSKYSEGGFGVSYFVKHDTKRLGSPHLAWLDLYSGSYFTEYWRDLYFGEVNRKSLYYRYAEVIDAVMYDSLNRAGFIELYLGAGTKEGTPRYGYHKHNTKDRDRAIVPRIFNAFIQGLIDPDDLDEGPDYFDPLDLVTSTVLTGTPLFDTFTKLLQNKKSINSYPLSKNYLILLNGSWRNDRSLKKRDVIGRNIFNRTHAVFVTIPRSKFGNNAKYIEGSSAIQCSLIPNGYHVYEDYNHGMYANVHFNLEQVVSPQNQSAGGTSDNQPVCPVQVSNHDLENEADCCEILFGGDTDPDDSTGCRRVIDTWIESQRNGLGGGR